MRQIPFFEYPRLYTDERESILKIIDEVASRGAFIMQKDVHDFERNLEAYTKSNHAVGVANATDGLEIAWLAIGLEPGDEVICSAHTMLATASAIKVAGGIPIPVDIREDGLIDEEAIESAITDRTRGIMPTQLNGRTCDMHKIMSIAQKNDLAVVEDAAQGLGSKFDGQHAGTFGDASAISFFPAKLMGSLGDAGAILTNNAELYDRAYQLHDHGRDFHGEVRSWGRNSRIDNLQAAILNYKFENYSNVVERRRQIAQLYQKGLEDVNELILPPAPDADPRHFDVYQNYEIQAKDRDELKLHLSEKGVGTLVQWGGKAIHQFEHLDIRSELPRVEAFFEACIMLPMNLFISDEDVDYICQCIKQFYKQR